MRCNRLPDTGLAYHSCSSAVCPAPTRFTSKIISYIYRIYIWRQYPVFQRAASPPMRLPPIRLRLKDYAGTGPPEHLPMDCSPLWQLWGRCVTSTHFL